MGKAVKNYTTKMPVHQSMSKIQEALIKHGATGIMTEYEQGTGRISALKFIIELEGNKVGFSLPVQWRLFQTLMQSQGVRRSDDDDYCYRVAWANIRDWVDAQMVLIELQMVELPQLFLPFAVTSNGQTLYEQVREGQFLLGSGQ